MEECMEHCIEGETQGKRSTISESENKAFVVDVGFPIC